MAIAVRPDSSSACGRETIDAGRLFEQYADRILGYCVRHLGNRAEAEDAVQTTFLYAHRALQRGIVPESEYAWLHSIAKNVCRWQQRTTFRRNRLRTGVELDAIASPPRSDDEDLLVGLGDALASIPENQQRALVLREWHGLSSSEVAAQLGMSPPATYALLTRARRSLAHALTALPEKTALGVITLVYELRSNIRAVLGGSAAAKTVAATTVVAAVAIGGVSVDRAVDGDRRVPQAPQPRVMVAAGAAEAQLTGAATRPVRDRAPKVVAASGSASSHAGTAVHAPGVGVGNAPTPASPPSEGVVPPQSPDHIGETPGSDVVPLLDDVPKPPALPVPLLPALPLPTDLLPPAPDPPPALSDPVPHADLPVPPLPDPALPSLP